MVFVIRALGVPILSYKAAGVKEASRIARRRSHPHRIPTVVPRSTSRKRSVLMRPRILLVSVLAAGCLAPEVSAQTSKADRSTTAWGAKVGLSYLATGGNSETSSAGFDVGFNRAWRAWSLEGGANGVSAT